MRHGRRTPPLGIYRPCQAPHVADSMAHTEDEPVVITGIGLITSTGRDRESVWRAVQAGRSGARRMEGIPGLDDGMVLGAPVNLGEGTEARLKAISLDHIAAEEAIQDAAIDLDQVDRERFACAVSGHMGDTRFVAERLNVDYPISGGDTPWWEQWWANTGCWSVATRYGLLGPRICHSTACASGLIDFLSAVRAIRDDQCDIALAGSSEAIDPIFAAGFRRMKVLAHDEDPARACRPFDRSRKGFIMGEGAAMFVVERLSHALARGAKIYAQVLGGKVLAEAHHVTGLDEHSDALAHLISLTLRQSGLRPQDIGYVNVHGTGTLQNDLTESRGIRLALGSAADYACVSANKSMLGHLVNAAGSVELAITALALRDGFAPPTINLNDPDPECRLDCVPLVGRVNRFQNALKLSVAFGGHLVAVVLNRWADAATGFDYPAVAKAG